MRIIGGTYRGLKLAEFDGDNIRPTADRVKESLFNILSWQMSGAKVLDLFCGSGNLGIECLSRGASYVHFNDLSKDSIAVLNRNLKKLKGEHHVSVTTGDYLACLNKLAAPFDIIFIDPPYRFGYGVPAMELIIKNNLLTKEGIVVYERDRAFQGGVQGLSLSDERKYGKTYLSFFKRTQHEE
jgi:16S rRNA (guanine(966)-N(2))-methyltransferase RsmD